MRAGPASRCGRGSKARASPSTTSRRPGIVRGDLRERGDRARVALDRDDAAGAFGEQRAGEAAGPGPDLDHGHAVERTGGAGDARGQIEVEQEILAERFPGGQTVAADDLAQRRQIVDPAHDAAAASRRLIAGGQPGGERERGDQARRVGAAGAGDVEGGAVIGRGAHERQAERHVDGVVEGERLDRDQRLVVIHAQRGVVGRARARRGTWCRRAAVRARRCRRRRSRVDRRRDDRGVLVAERAVLAGMRIEAGDGEARAGDAEAARQGRARRCGRSRRSGRRSSRCGTSASGRWMVTGTTASSGDHSIITGRDVDCRCVSCARRARYSVWPGSAKPER